MGAYRSSTQLFLAIARQAAPWQICLPSTTLSCSKHLPQPESQGRSHRLNLLWRTPLGAYRNPKEVPARHTAGLTPVRDKGGTPSTPATRGHPPLHNKAGKEAAHSRTRQGKAPSTPAPEGIRHSVFRQEEHRSIPTTKPPPPPLSPEATAPYRLRVTGLGTGFIGVRPHV